MEDLIPIEIVKKIIEHVDTWTELINCRLINHKWNILSSQVLKTKSLHPFIYFYSEERLKEFLKCMESSINDEIPFTKFHFQLDTFCMTENMVLFHQKYDTDIHELSFELREKRLTPRGLEKLQIALEMARHTPNLNCLQLNILCPIAETEAFAHLLPRLSLPKLRSIKLCRDITTAKENDGRLRLMGALKNAAPYLEEINIAPWKGTQLSRISPLQRIFKDTPRMVLSNVTFLTYHPLDSEALHTGTYKLTQLEIRLNYDFEKAEQYHLNMDHIRLLLCQWLESHSNTLRTLKVILEGVSEIRIPSLRVLTSLEVGLGTYDDVDMGNGLIPFQPKQFPNLRYVGLNFYSEDWNLFSVENPFDNVEGLKLQGYQEAFVKLRWDLIFPNLNTLELICVKGEQLKVFLRQMSMIVNLKIQLSDYMTQVIDSISSIGFENGEEGENISKKDSSSLSNLTRLKTLEIRGCGPIALDKIVTMTRDGHLKSLVNLSIDADQISEEQLGILESVHGNVNKMTRK